MVVTMLITTLSIEGHVTLNICNKVFAKAEVFL